MAPMDIPSKLYDLKSGNVLHASFVWRGDGSGPTTITKADEVCAGEYRTIMEGRTSVGVGATAGPWGAIFGALHSTSSTEKAQRGFAVAICPSKHAFECEYVTNVSLGGVTGHGACKDNRGETYRLMF